MKIKNTLIPWRVFFVLVLGVALTGCLNGGTDGDGADIVATNIGNSSDALSEITLEEMAYRGDQDPPPRDDVDVEVMGLDEGDRLTPATRADYGYQTHIVAAGDMPEATAAGPFRVVTVGDDSLVLAGDTSDIQAGDVIAGVADDGNHTPVLRRVKPAADGTVVSLDGVVRTEAVDLDDAFPVVDLSITLEAFNEEGVSAGVTLVDSEARLLYFQRSVAYQFPGGVTTTGQFSMSSSFQLRLDMGWTRNPGELTGRPRVNNARVVLSAEPRALARIDVDLPFAVVSRTWSKEFNPIFNKTRTIVIYGIPVPLNLKVTPELAAKAEVGGRLQAAFGLDVSVEAEGGFSYSEPSGLSFVNDFTPVLRRIGPTYEADAGALVLGEANMNVMLSIFEANIDTYVFGRINLDGPGVGTSVGPFAQLSVKASTRYGEGASCAASLAVGLQSDLIADLGPVAAIIDAERVADLSDNITVSGGGKEISLNVYSTNPPRTLWSEEFDCGAVPGTLSGYVADARDGMALEGVTVAASNSSGEVRSVITDSSGNYRMEELAPGPYTVTYSKAGYESANARVTIGSGEDTSLNRALLMEEQGYGAMGTLVITVRNARTGAPLSRAYVAVRRGLENRAGPVIETATTGADGKISINIPAGYYTIEAAKGGFDSGYISSTVRTDSSGSGGGVAQVVLSPMVESDREARIILTWGQDPSDLDSHLFGPGGHIAYYSMTSGDGSLDVDDTDGFGPETITITSVDPTATYNYWVHHYTGAGTIASSGAQVNVNYGGLTYAFSAPAEAIDSWWHVFDIVDGEIRACRSDCVVSGGSREGPAAAASLVSPESRRVLPPVDQLPRKY